MSETTKQVIWFNARSCVGLVRVSDIYDGVKYYIGSPPDAGTMRSSEEEDVQWIADWGAKFPREIGDKLFGVEK